jgi:hypothetical protein
MLWLRDMHTQRRKQIFPTSVPKVDIFINREHIFEDSYRLVMNMSPAQLLVSIHLLSLAFHFLVLFLCELTVPCFKFDDYVYLRSRANSTSSFSMRMPWTTVASPGASTN